MKEGQIPLPDYRKIWRREEAQVAYPLKYKRPHLWITDKRIKKHYGHQSRTGYIWHPSFPLGLESATVMHTAWPS